MKVSLMGGPKHGNIIDMGKFWGGPAAWQIPPTFRVPEYQFPKHPITGRQNGVGWMSIVDYHFYRKTGDVLVYIRPGYVVGSL